MFVNFQQNEINISEKKEKWIIALNSLLCVHFSNKKNTKKVACNSDIV